MSKEEGNIREAMEPIATLEILPKDMKNITLVTKKVKGTPHPTKKIGTARWGGDKRRKDSPPESMAKLIDTHPLGKAWLSRKQVIPPYVTRHEHPENGQWYEEYEFARHNDPDHWYIDNYLTPEERENIKTPYVLSVSHRGEYLLWHNLNVLGDEDIIKSNLTLKAPIDYQKEMGMVDVP